MLSFERQQVHVAVKTMEIATWNRFQIEISNCSCENVSIGDVRRGQRQLDDEIQFDRSSSFVLYRRMGNYFEIDSNRCEAFAIGFESFINAIQNGCRDAGPSDQINCTFRLVCGMTNDYRIFIAAKFYDRHVCHQ